MEEAPENGKESSHSAHTNEWNEWMNVLTVDGDNSILLHISRCVWPSSILQITSTFFSNVIRFMWLFSDIFTFTWLHCTSLPRHGSSDFSNLINLIPDLLRWYMGIAFISDWLCCFCTSGIYSCAFLKLFTVFLYLWPSDFKTVITVNRCKTNHRKLRAACTIQGVSRL